MPSMCQKLDPILDVSKKERKKEKGRKKEERTKKRRNKERLVD